MLKPAVLVLNVSRFCAGWKKLEHLLKSVPFPEISLVELTLEL